MTDEEIAVKLTDLDNRVKNLNYRVSDVESNGKLLSELTASVKVLATNMEHMTKEQAKQGERLERLEEEPAKSYKHYKQTIITSIITAITGMIMGGLLTMLIK